MYNDLYKAWKHESESAELGKLPSDFYSRMAEYLRGIKEESRMLDKKTVKAALLKGEMLNVKRLLRELIELRYKKLIKNTSEGKEPPKDFLTVEEEKICSGILPVADAYSSFLKSILQGCAPRMNVEREHERAALRFLKDIPAIVGADMKTYGPFKTEDVAAVPIENAKVLIKQGLAEKIDTG